MERERLGWSTTTAGTHTHGLEVFHDGDPAIRAAYTLLSHGRVRSPLVQRARHVLEQSMASHGTYMVSFVTVSGWRAEMRLALQNSRLIVSGLHVTRAHGEGPPGGITSRLLRHVPVHAHVQAVANMLRWPHTREALEALVVGTGLEGLLSAQASAGAARVRASTASLTGPPRRGRRPIATELLLTAASPIRRPSRGTAPIPRGTRPRRSGRPPSGCAISFTAPDAAAC